jgi:hypothetical protein
MNLSPMVFPVATALEFQEPSSSTAELIEERLPKAIDDLMKKVHSQWSRRRCPDSC